MGQGRQYESIDAHKGGKRAALVLIIAMIGSVAILGASVFLGLKLASLAGKDETEAPPPPPPVPIPQFTVNLTSPLQLALLFMEAQKSGNLPDDYPFTWRNNSGLSDGFDQNRNLTGGFYDGGGTVKYTFPIAFSVTMLSWSVIDYGVQFEAQGQADKAISLIQWGVDYLRAAKYKNIIFAQVGIPDIDESCWTRPEDMLRRHRVTPYPCEPAHPCSDLAGEMAAALAAASIIFRDPKKGNPVYADEIVATAEELWDFANTYRGKYSDWVVTAQSEYNSTGYVDELLWGAAWLYYATGDSKYLDYVTDGERMSTDMEAPLAPGTFEEAMVFNWDKKSPGVAVLMTRLLTIGLGADQYFNDTNIIFRNVFPYATTAVNYVAQFLPKNQKIANFTVSGKLTWGGPRERDLVRPLEIAVNTAYLSMVLLDYIWPARSTNSTSPLASVYWQGSTWDDVISYYVTQKNYIIGDNPMKMCYMVGWKGLGLSYPTNVYHKGASIPSYWLDKEKYNCVTGNFWLESPSPNPITLFGALVGGPDRNDTYLNVRTNRNHSEPKTHLNAVWAGLLAGTSLEDNKNRPGIFNYDRMWPNLPWAAKKARQIEKLLPRSAPPPPSNATAPPPPTFDIEG